MHTKEKREKTQAKSEMRKKLPQTAQEYKGSYKNTMRDSMTPNSITRTNGSVPRNMQLPGLNQKEVENPNRPISSEECETYVMNFPES